MCCSIFARLSVPIVRAVADSGSIGGSLSHEYHVLSSTGEDTVLICDTCHAAGNDEIARCEYCIAVPSPCHWTVAAIAAPMPASTKHMPQPTEELPLEESIKLMIEDVPMHMRFFASKDNSNGTRLSKINLHIGIYIR